MDWPKSLFQTAWLFTMTAAGGWLAARVGLPLPWMIGPLLMSGIAVALFQDSALRDYRFPMPVRNLFIALIGVMIGTTVTPRLFADLAALPATLAGLAVFVAVAQAGNHLIFRRVGRYDRSTAFFCATPGGLMEAIAMGEEAGADLRLVTVQQFLRIILVVTAIPLALSVYLGEPVGSAAGVVPGGAAPVSALDLLFILAAAGVGLVLGKRIHLPAGQIIGPLLFSAALTLSGQVDLHLPSWLVAMAQWVIGTTLGLRFTGVTARLLQRAFGLSLVSVLFMLAVGAALSELLHLATGQDVLQLLISFAPGGVTEMSLVALSLSINPALVSLHHVLRILMTVAAMGLTAKAMGLIPRPSPRA